MIPARELLLAASCAFAMVPLGPVLADEPAAPERQPSAAASAPVAMQGVTVTLALMNRPASQAKGESDVLLGELAKGLEATDGLTVLDRDSIEKLLAEHRLSVAGVVRKPIEHGRMLGAKYLLYVEQEQISSSQTLAMICIEVSSGNVIWERAFAVDAAIDLKARAGLPSEVARDVFAAITANEQHRSRPTASVLAVANRSRSSRLDFMETSLQGVLEDLLDAHGYRVLRRRNPGLLAKETTLGTFGMVRPDAAVLAEAADLVVTASFAESPSGDVAFEQTPIKLTLGLKHRGRANQDTSLTFTLAELKDLASKLRLALLAAGAASVTTSAPANGHVSGRLEAARLMAELKDLPFVAPLEDHRRQIELAQRVIYLDPSAKDAYYRLGISLDALTRKTWHQGGSHEGSSRDTADALSAYLGFPRTSQEHVHWAFCYLALHHEVLYKGSPQKHLPLMAKCIRWRHQQDPVNPPRLSYWPQYHFPDWWDSHPQERIDFYNWVDNLYKEKKHLSVFPFRLALAYNQLKKYDEAAEYLHDGLVSHRLRQLELNGVIGDASSWLTNGHARELATRLDTKRSAELLARLANTPEEREQRRGNVLSRLYGPAYRDAKDLYDYSYRSDRERIGKLQCQTVQPEAVLLGQTLVQSVIVRQTTAGLWMQGGTTDGTLALFFSEDGRKWQAIDTPEQMKRIRGYENLAEAENRVVSIVQLGDEVLFATLNAGLFVCDRKKAAWRHYGDKEGLAAKAIAQMAASADGKSAWIAGGGFLCRYQDGKLFLPKVKIDLFPDGMVACGGRLLAISNEQLLAIQPESVSKTVLLSRSQQRGLLPVPPIFHGPPRSYNAGVNTLQRLLTIGEKVCFVGEHGLAVLTAAGQPVALWRPDAFYRWNELGGWVMGNCPLPPCSMMEVIQDDQNHNLLWLVSKENDVIPPYTFGYGAYPKALWNSILELGRDTTCFITAFDTETNRFSKPVRTKTPFTHAQPFGDYVYLTGRTFSRLPKKLWVVDQPGMPGDQPPRVECPDTPVGRASRAVLLGRRDEAMKHIQEALEAGMAPDEIKKMVRELAAQAQAEAKPASAGTQGDKSK